MFSSLLQVDSVEVIVLDAGGTLIADAPVTWTSSDPTVVAVEPEGFASSVSNGEAYVVATSGLASDSVRAVVEQVPFGFVVGQPEGDVAPGLPISIVVSTVDSLGSPVESFVDEVSLSLVDDQAAVLSGTTQMAADAGVAVFSDLMVSRSGRDFLVRAATAADTAFSLPFDVRNRFTSISARSRNVCALSATGDAYCWGLNQTGGLGIGTAGTNQNRPVLVEGSHSFVQVSAGWFSSEGGVKDGFGCGVTSGHDVYCWGRNEYGQLGNGTSGGTELVPVLVSGGHAFRHVTAGRDHACGLTTADEAYCWGRGDQGQLGVGPSPPAISAVPVAVAGGLQFQSLEAGSFRTCGLATDATTYCWHSNTGLPASILFEPTTIPGSVTLVQIDPGPSRHLCGITADGSGRCWGDNDYGELGTADRVDRPEPTQIAGGHAWTRISAGSEMSCGLRDDGTVLCWGRDFYGETGQGSVGGTGVEASPPVPIVGGLTFTELSSGSATMCGLTSEGEAYCWGLGSRGARGDGTFTLGVGQPVQVVLPGG